jgi:hypothetical protein
MADIAYKQYPRAVDTSEVIALETGCAARARRWCGRVGGRSGYPSGFGLALLVLRRGIDASVQPIAIIRGLLAAAFVAILRRWKWWLPARSARIFRVKASPIHAEPAPQTT